MMSVEDIAGNMLDVNVYPNPASYFITMQMQLDKAENISYKIFNIYGQLVEDKNLKKQFGSFSHTIDFSSYVNGFYLLQINYGNNVVSKKIIKHE